MLKGQYAKLMIGDKGPIKKVYEGDELIWQKPWSGIKITVNNDTAPSLRFGDVVNPLVLTKKAENQFVADYESAPSMFWFAKSKTNIVSADLSKIDLSQVATMDSAFSGCTSLEDVSFPAVVNAGTSCQFVFDNTKITEFSGIGWDVSSVTSMYSMFEWCESLESIDLSTWVTASLTNIGFMFQRCPIKEIDLSNFDVSKVTTMQQAFYKCAALESVNLSNWTFMEGVKLLSLFNGCSSLKTIDLSSSTVGTVGVTTSIFDGCKQLESVKVAGCDATTISNLISILNSNWAATKNTWHQDGDYLVP